MSTPGAIVPSTYCARCGMVFEATFTSPSNAAIAGIGHWYSPSHAAVIARGVMLDICITIEYAVRLV